MNDDTPSKVFDAENTFAEAALNAVSEGVVRLTPDGKIAAINDAAQEILDAPSAVLIGRTLLQATHLRQLSELAAQTQASGEPREAHVRLVGRGERVVRVRIVPMRSNEEGVLILLMDQTEIQRLRTVRTEFVANVSHELRTPLASIRATAETLINGAIEDPEFAARFLETIVREADRLVRLSDDLLELSRAESTQPEPTAFALQALIVDVATRLRGLAERQQVSVTLRMPDDTIVIEADHSHLDQVFFNLMENAIKYTPSGGSVVVGVESRAADWAAIYFEDTGIGMLAQDLPRIFERFWRADRARRFKGSGGTGLGLSIVKHIVEAHGGVVTAESELGQGSRFTVVLPLQPIDTAASASHQKKSLE